MSIVGLMVISASMDYSALCLIALLLLLSVGACFLLWCCCVIGSLVDEGNEEWDE